MTKDQAAQALPETMDSAAQLEQLRTVLVGRELAAMRELQQDWQDKEANKARVAQVVSEAITLRNLQDDSVARVLSPTLEAVVERSVEKDPHKLASTLYPVMGPAIRKSIHETLSQTLENLNQLLEQSLSMRMLLWRFDAWRTGRRYSEVVLMKTLLYQVEQVFLIHRETGLLLQHVVSPKAISKDPDMVSGMLTAIQDFVHDSFSTDENAGLNSLRLGELTVLIEQGSHAVVAAVVRGNPPAQVRGDLAAALDKVQTLMLTELKQFAGDNEAFERVQPELEACLTHQQKQTTQRQPWWLYAFLLLLLGGLLYWGYSHYQQQQNWQQVIQTLQAEPGLVVTQTQQRAGNYHIKGLLDPLARPPEAILAASPSAEKVPLSFDLRPYLSMDQTMVLQRAHHVLQPPEGVKLALQDNGVLQVSGHTTEADWAARLATQWPLLAGVTALDQQALQVQDQQRQQALQTTIQAIEAADFNFAKGSSDLQAADVHAQRMKAAVDKLLDLARQQDKLLQITITGLADEVGSTELNQRLVRERANNMRDFLIQQGLPAAVLFANKQGDIGSTERGVRYRVHLY